jgi:hypothetical protein
MFEKHRAMRWRMAFGKLNHGTDWSDAEVDRLKAQLVHDVQDGFIPVVDALVAAHRSNEGDEDADNVRACLLACQAVGWTQWSRGDLLLMMSNLMSSYDSWETAIDDWLRKAGPGVKVEWLNTEHPDLRQAIQGKDQIWVQRPTGEGRLYVFLKP